MGGVRDRLTAELDTQTVCLSIRLPVCLSVWDGPGTPNLEPERRSRTWVGCQDSESIPDNS